MDLPYYASWYEEPVYEDPDYDELDLMLYEQRYYGDFTNYDELAGCIEESFDAYKEACYEYSYDFSTWGGDSLHPDDDARVQEVCFNEITDPVYEVVQEIRELGGDVRFVAGDWVDWEHPIALRIDCIYGDTTYHSIEFCGWDDIYNEDLMLDFMLTAKGVIEAAVTGVPYNDIWA